MPLYDYTCQRCDHTFELNRKISERDETNDLVCPECSVTGEIARGVAAPMFAYGIVTKGGYGSNLGGFKDVLEKIHRRTVGSNLDKTSSYDIK